MADEQSRVISRRELLRNAGLAGAAAVAGPLAGGPESAEAAQQVASTAAAPTVRREALEHLPAAEADLLDAVLDRLIPSDEHGPGAREARVIHYIDRALGGALASSRPAYLAGLAALNQYARSARGKGFLELANADRDAILIDVESGRATGFADGSARFFAMVLAHARQGMFGDPYYGGNANFVGWDLLGYPGIRTMVTAADQKAYEAGTLQPSRRSAYDYDTFNKATASAAPHAHGDASDGDQA
ncbi:MAG: gluconate 2-dehydrogenase subunit 3 family protein [Acidobacteria bacterium]|nr:gluconate 2-dehydrogenase subunit 3 family protein [Acidobacteriota bacterium]